MNPALCSILGCGAVTPVGLTAEATAAALRAGIDNFQETRFIAQGGEWIMGAEVPLDQPWRGIAKLSRLLAGAVGQCLDLCPDHRPEDIPLLLTVAEEERPGRLQGLDDELFHEASKLLDVTFHEDSRIFPHGRVGGAMALKHAIDLMREKSHQRLIVAGVDSYLVGPTLNAYDERERLLTPENSDGFIPGEAAAAFVAAPPAERAPGSNNTLRCHGIGFGKEQATIESEEPLRGAGLMDAFKQALTQAGIQMADIGYRLSSLSGEQYWFKEAELATSRLLRGKHDFMDFLHPASGVGETGAAALPVLTHRAFAIAQKEPRYGDPALTFTSSDANRRAALLLGYKGAN